MLNKFAAKELEQLAKRHGGLLKPEKVAKRAEDPNSALHEFFEWDKDTAQAKLHLLIARQLIRAYEVYVEVKDSDTPQKVRAFVSLSTDRKGGGGYRLLSDVMNDTDRRAQLMTDALNELESFQRKYKQLTQLEPIFQAIETVRRDRSRPQEELRASA